MRAHTSTAAVSLFFVVAFAMACSSSSSGSSGSSGSAGVTGGPAQEKACLDTIEALARAAERCGQSYQANYDAALQNAAAGDCKKIIAIRDEAALRSTCLPGLMTITCANLTAGNLDASCKAQLQRPASFTPTLDLSPASVSVVGDEL